LVSGQVSVLLQSGCHISGFSGRKYGIRLALHVGVKLECFLALGVVNGPYESYYYFLDLKCNTNLAIQGMENTLKNQQDRSVLKSKFLAILGKNSFFPSLFTAASTTSLSF